MGSNGSSEVMSCINQHVHEHVQYICIRYSTLRRDVAGL